MTVYNQKIFFLVFIKKNINQLKKRFLEVVRYIKEYFSRKVKEDIEL